MRKEYKLPFKYCDICLIWYIYAWPCRIKLIRATLCMLVFRQTIAICLYPSYYIKSFNSFKNNYRAMRDCGDAVTPVYYHTLQFYAFIIVVQNSKKNHKNNKRVRNMSHIRLNENNYCTHSFSDSSRIFSISYYVLLIFAFFCTHILFYTILFVQFYF